MVSNLRKRHESGEKQGMREAQRTIETGKGQKLGEWTSEAGAKGKLLEVCEGVWLLESGLERCG